jgi:hypothetical protein
MPIDLAKAARYRHWRMLKFTNSSVVDEPRSTPAVEAMLTTAQRRRFPIAFTPYRITVTRPATGISWTLTPKRDNQVSDAQWRDLAFLAHIADKNGSLAVAVTAQGFRLGGRFGQLGAQASHILIERGWILLPYRDGEPAHLSWIGRRSLAWHHENPPRLKDRQDMVIVPGHRTETYLGAVLPNAQQYMRYSSTGRAREYVTRSGAGARCECGWTTGTATLTEARSRARYHRLEMRDQIAQEPAG